MISGRKPSDKFLENAQTAEERVKTKGPYPWTEALKVMVAVTDALPWKATGYGDYEYRTLVSDERRIPSADADLRGDESVDVDADPELARRHAEEIPVVLVDGVPRDFWQIDERRLARLLRERLAG